MNTVDAPASVKALRDVTVSVDSPPAVLGLSPDRKRTDGELKELQQEYAVKVAEYVEKWRHRHPDEWDAIVAQSAAEYPEAIPEPTRGLAIRAYAEQQVRKQKGLPVFEEWARTVEMAK